MATIGVIDYGMGNLHSLAKAVERVAGDNRVEISYDPDVLKRTDRLVLPGVGGANKCMAELKRLGLNQMVAEFVEEKPMVGICLGMQILLDYSEENQGVDALGFFPGEVVRFPEPAASGDDRLKVPHMGWNQVHQTREHDLWKGIPQDSWFYFVHSYRAAPKNAEHSLGETDYGGPFTSVLLKDNVFGVQFHPEKSQHCGLQLLSNFVHWNGEA